MGCQEFECFVCGQCKEEPTTEPAYTTDPKELGIPNERVRTDTQMADATIVYVLGYLEDTPATKQVDEYSGLNGYHIRTIPGKRWNTPVMIGAGSGYLAVVDRFQDYDLIRVTDKYAGATAAGFDSNGFPLDSVDWASLPDICSQATPNGTRVTGLKITPLGMVVAHLSNTSSYLKFDALGRESGSVSRVMEGTNTLKAPFNTLGTLIGTPAVVNANIGAHQFYTVSLIRTPAGSVAALIIDTLQHKVIGLQGIPSSPTPISATISNNVMSVLCGDDGIASQVIRFIVNFEGGGLISGTKSGKATPTPQEYTVEQFPKMKDFGGRNFTPDKLSSYYRIASQINESANAENRVIPTSFDADNLPQPNESSTTLNDNRVSAEAHIISDYYTKSFSVPVHIIPIAETLGLKAIESGYGTITEMFNRKSLDGTMDRVKPIFRVLHGGHYDIVSEGGYTYGSNEGGYTNGMVGESLATDKDYELGTLKTIDAKAALIDARTGLILYRHPKPTIESGGYTVYGGDYASLDPEHTNSTLEAEVQALLDDINRLRGESEWATANGFLGYADLVNTEVENTTNWKSKLDARLTSIGSTGTKVQRTTASTDAETNVTGYDGVERRVTNPILSPSLYPARVSENGDPVTAFNINSECADDYWTMFLRRGTIPNKFSVRLTKKNWSRLVPTEFGTPPLLPEWVTHDVNPIHTSSNFNMLVPPNVPSMLVDHPIQLTCVGTGGFFAPNFSGVTMSNHDRYNEEISSLTALNEDYQRIVNAGGNQSRYLSYIMENNDRISDLQNQVSSIALREFYMTPRSILAKTFNNLDRSVGQATPYTPEVLSPVSEETASANKWGTIVIGESTTKKRACVTETGPGSWVGVTIKMRADSMNGVDRWLYPETKRGSLGIRVGSIDFVDGPENIWGVAGGNIYSSGWECSLFGDGAWAKWGYKVEGSSQLVSTDVATIRSLAPQDAQDILLGNMIEEMGSIYDEYFYRRLYFRSDTPLTRIVIEFWLSHTAYDVFRFGAHTIYFKDTLGDSWNCPKTDPGYYAGLNVTAIGCGNVTSLPGWKKLLSSDLTYPVVERDIMTGRAIFTCTNPYDSLGLGYGTIWKCDVDFNLNNNVRGFDIPLIPSDIERTGGK